MITITTAQIYSMAGEMAYEAGYSDGTAVRVVESAGGMIRKEFKRGDTWVQAGKAYIVRHNKRRQAESLKEQVSTFLRKAWEDENRRPYR